MKLRKIQIAMLSLLLIQLYSCQDKNSANTEETVTKTETSSEDSAALADKKKLQAKQELAKLPKPYHPGEDAAAKLAELMKRAEAENKNIIIQAGGNWCIWCLRFNEYVQTTPELKNLVDENYLYYHLNYSPEDKNEKLFSKYGDPGKKYGYPVFLVLDSKGKLLHTQDSSVLEEGKGYSLEKVKTFFEKWKPAG